MTAEDRHWCVVQTQPHAEARAASHLARQGFDVYLPRYQKRRRHARRVETVAAPLFPRYLFVAIAMASQRWRSIQSTVGVSRLVCNGDMPAAVRRGVVEDLKHREQGGLVLLEPRPRFALGEKVRVLNGVFANHLALFDGMADSERVAVLLEMLGRRVRVLIDDLSVTAA